jgi:hypothetical protein
MPSSRPRAARIPPPLLLPHRWGDAGDPLPDAIQNRSLDHLERWEIRTLHLTSVLRVLRRACPIDARSRTSELPGHAREHLMSPANLIPAYQ